MLVTQKDTKLNIKLQNQIIVDIDNTLWDFAPVLFEELKSVTSNVPEIEHWTDWDFWRTFVSEKDFFSCINKIHQEQDKYGVYPDAKEFLEFIYESGFRIIIASHREQNSREATLNWLKKHKLPFHELHLSFDKTVLFDENKTFAVVDDSPHIIAKAKTKNINATGLKFPWNQDYHCYLFSCLSDIKEYVKSLQNKTLTQFCQK